MSATAKKKETTSATPAPAAAKAPALVAYYAIPAPKGQRPTLSPIGAAIAHDDDQGFTLQLHLMPPVGAHILLRKPPVKKNS